MQAQLPSSQAAAFPSRASTLVPDKDVLCVLLGSRFPSFIPASGLGEGSVSAAQCRQEGSRSFPLCLPTVQLRCPKMRLSGWDAMGGGCPFHGTLVGKGDERCWCGSEQVSEPRAVTASP